MDKTEYGKNAVLMIKLISGVLNDKKPDEDLLSGIDPGKLFTVARAHNLAAITAYALEEAGIKYPAFSEAKDKAIRKNILLDAEREAVTSEMEKKGIWYMPLKGALLHEWYPRIGMRQMADNDILCDSTRMEEVKGIFVSRGYYVKLFGKSNHDVYYKAPVYNFEMHSGLFSSKSHSENLWKYYEGIENRLVNDGKSKFGRRFTNEDFYLYMLAHEWKHFSGSGTGLRSLVDTYVFLKKFGNALDWDYISDEAEKLEILDFEKNNRTLSCKLFDRERLSDEEKKLLSYYVYSGTYGNLENQVSHKLQKLNGSRLKYLKGRLFPSREYLAFTVPWVEKSPLLVPAGWIYRIIYRTKRGGKRFVKEFGLVIKNKEE